MADKAYLVPRIDAPEYIETLLGNVVINTTPSADNPKLYTPNIVVGNKAIVTNIIILLVVTLERICGEDDILNCSLTLVHLFLYFSYFFLLFASAIFLMEPIACFN